MKLGGKIKMVYDTFHTQIYIICIYILKENCKNVMLVAHGWAELIVKNKFSYIRTQSFKTKCILWMFLGEEIFSYNIKCLYSIIELITTSH